MTTTPTQVLALPWISTHRRRVAGAAGIPTLSPPVQSGETIVNEVDAGGLIEYYGAGNDGNGNATSVVPAAGQGFIDARAQVAAATSVKFGRRVVADANYAMAATDVYVAFRPLTASRTATLPAASAVPAGQPFVIADESGACSPTCTISIVAAGTDTIAAAAGVGGTGSSSMFLSGANRRAILYSDGVGAWTVFALPYRGPAYVTPFDFGAVGNGKVDDTAALQAAWTFLQGLQAPPLYMASGTLDLCGGMFAISAAITASGAPYGLTIRDGSVIPFGSYAGTFFDFTGTTTTTNLRFNGLRLNGFQQASGGIKLGPKTQGAWIDDNLFVGFTRAGIEDTSPVAATELKITNNQFLGGKQASLGIGIIANGNDGHAIGNIMANLATGIQLNGSGAWLFALNHIYSIQINGQPVPVPLLDIQNCSQVQILDNYLDEGFIYLRRSSGCQIVGNKFLFGGTSAATMTLPSGVVVPWSPIVIAPQNANYSLYDFTVTNNNFYSLFGSGFNPVYTDTTNGTIGQCNNTEMRGNGFTGFNAKYSEPWSRVATSSATTSLSIDFTSKIPWGTLSYVKFYTLESAGSVTGVTVSGNVAALALAANYASGGVYSIGGTVNHDGN